MIQGILVLLFSSLVTLHSFRPIASSNTRRSHDLFAVQTAPAVKATPAYLSGQIHTDRIFVGNLPFTITETIVRDIIDTNMGNGKIKEIKIAKGQKSKRPLGFLFVDFIDFEHADKAVNLFDGYDLDGRILNSNLKYLDDVSLIKTAIQSAEKAKAAPLTSLKSSNTIYLSNLDYSLDEEEICNMCDDLVGLGLVNEIRIPLDKETGSSRGFAYIEFKDSASVDIAIQELSEVEVYGRILKVERMSMPKKKEVEPVLRTLEEEEEDIFASLSY